MVQEPVAGKVLALSVVEVSSAMMSMRS